jgi:hypothetical protein
VPQPTTDQVSAPMNQLKAVVQRLAEARMAGQPVTTTRVAPLSKPAPDPTYKLTLIHRYDPPSPTVAGAGFTVEVPEARRTSAARKQDGVYRRVRGSVELAVGDCLVVGRQVFQFEQPGESEISGVRAGERSVILGTADATPWGRLRHVAPATLVPTVFELCRNDIVIGRELCDIPCPDDDYISRRHAQLSRRQGRPTLSDLNSSNGTFLRQRPPYTLTVGDLLRMGEELLRFEIG